MADSNSSFTFNNDVTGGNVQINQGQKVTATQTVNNAGSDMDLDKFFDQLAKILTPAEAAVQESISLPNPLFSPELLADASTPAMTSIKGCIAALDLAKEAEESPEVPAETPTTEEAGMSEAVPADEEDKETMLQNLHKKIKLYGPIAGKVILAFGAAALEATIAKNPIVAGLIASIQQVQKEVDAK